MNRSARDAGAATGAVWAPIACAAVVAMLALMWIAGSPAEQLRQHLRLGQFWFLEALLVSFLGVSVVAGRQVIRILDTRTKAVAGVLVCTAAALVLLAPRTNRIFYDEQIYQGIGQNLSDLRLAQMCNDGTLEYGALQCWRYEYNKQPYGYPHLLSVGYRLFGPSDLIAHRLNVLMSGATAGAIFLLTVLLTRERIPSGFAAVAFMLLPEQLRWSHSAAVEPSAAFACAAAMLAAAAFLRLRSTAALVWIVVSSSWAAYLRPEGILIAGVVACVLLLFARDELSRPRMFWAIALWVCLLTPAAAHLAAVRNESWGSSEAVFSLPFFWNNVRTNSTFYIADRRFPAAIMALAIAGLAPTRVTAILAGWFAAFWGVFLFFYAGSYDYGADVRYSLMSYAPLAALAGIGAARLLRRASAGGASRATVAIAAGVLLLQFTWYLPWVRSVGEEAWAARADVEFAREVELMLPPNSVVLTHNPGMFHVWGVSAAQLSLAAEDPAFVRDELLPRYAGGVYLHWNFWCNVPDPVQRAFCNRVLSAYPATVFQERRLRDFRYAFYRIASEPAR